MKNDAIINFVSNLLINEILFNSAVGMQCSKCCCCVWLEALDTASNQYGESILTIYLSFLPVAHEVCGPSTKPRPHRKFKQMHLAQWRR